MGGAPPVLETVCTMSERSSLHSCLSWLRLKFFRCTGKFTVSCRHEEDRQKDLLEVSDFLAGVSVSREEPRHAMASPIGVLLGHHRCPSMSRSHRN